MDLEISLQNAHTRLLQHEERIRALEANSRNGESGTTTCSAAGGGIEQCKPPGSAGRVPLLSEFRVEMEELFKLACTRYMQGNDTAAGYRNFYGDILSEIDKFIEERRGDAGCVEPPAG